MGGVVWDVLSAGFRMLVTRLTRNLQSLPSHNRLNLWIYLFICLFPYTVEGAPVWRQGIILPQSSGSDQSCNCFSLKPQHVQWEKLSVLISVVVVVVWMRKCFQLQWNCCCSRICTGVCLATTSIYTVNIAFFFLLKQLKQLLRTLKTLNFYSLKQNVLYALVFRIQSTIHTW